MSFQVIFYEQGGVFQRRVLLEEESLILQVCYI